MDAIGSCPSCASPLAQPLGWTALPAGGGALLDLRCPECDSCSRLHLADGELAALERRCADHRATIVRAYEASVTESMEALGELLAEALSRDLVGPDDFAPR